MECVPPMHAFQVGDGAAWLVRLATTFAHPVARIMPPSASNEPQMPATAPWEWVTDYLDQNQALALRLVRTRVEELTKAPFHLHFTDHSVQHSDRIMERLKEILWNNLHSDSRLTGYELMILSCATYLHDLGMQWTYDMAKSKFIELTNPPYHAYEDVRSSHAGRSAVIIRANLGIVNVPVPDLGIRSSKAVSDVGAYIADCVVHHQGGHNVSAQKDDFSGTVIRVGLLRGLLRLADTLDMDHRRVDMERLTLYDIPVDSKIHWWSHHYVKSVRVENGKIKVAFWFPDTLAAPISKFFVRRVLGKIREELDLHQDLLWDERIFLKLDTSVPATSSFEPGLARVPLPADVEAEINRLIAVEMRTSLEAAGPAVAIQPAAPGGGDWISYWGFVGNPWVDLPAAVEQEDFVQTRSVARIVSGIKGILAGRSGQIQLLLGRRGLGKTTLFDNLPHYFPFEDYDTAIVSLGEDIRVFRNSRELSAFLFSHLYAHMKGKMPERIEIADLKSALAEYHHKKLIVCFGNLDRFVEKADLDTIAKFFAESQAALQTVARKAVVVIAAAPEWGPALSSEHLGYLNFDTAWKLEAFNAVEARELITRRLKIAGRGEDEVFSKDAVGVINTMASGNPRLILRRCAALCEAAASKKKKVVDKGFIAENRTSETDVSLAKTMWDLTSKSPQHNKALGSIYSFYEAMERGSLDSDKGWSMFIQLAAGAVVSSIIDPGYLPALAYVTERTTTRGEEATRQLNSDVRTYLRDWCQDGLTASDFVSIFRLKPVHPKDFGADLLRQIQIATLPDDVKWYVEASRAYYKQAMEERIFPTKVVSLSWKCVEYLLKAYLLKKGAVKENAFADDKLGEDVFEDDRGRIRPKKTDQLVAEAYGLLSTFNDRRKATDTYVKSLDQIRLLLRKYEQLLNAGVHYRTEAIQLAEENARLCRVALPQVYAEIIGMLF